MYICFIVWFFFSFESKIFSSQLITNRVNGKDDAIACPSVCHHSIVRTDWTLNLSFVCVCGGVTIDHSSPGIESQDHMGQGQRSVSSAYGRNNAATPLVWPRFLTEDSFFRSCCDERDASKTYLLVVYICGHWDVRGMSGMQMRVLAISNDSSILGNESSGRTWWTSESSVILLISNSSKNT